MFLYYGYFRKSAADKILQRRLQDNTDEQDLVAGPYYKRCVWKRKQEGVAVLEEWTAPQRNRRNTAPLRYSRQPR